MKLCSYWLDTAPAFTSGASGSVPANCDVAVVGGGLTGLSAALHLARQGIDVVVLESDGVAAAASGRNGGHCNNGLVRNFASVVEKYGLERAGAFYRAFDAAVDTVAQVVVRENVDCNFQHNGKIQLAAKPGHFEASGESPRPPRQGHGQGYDARFPPRRSQARSDRPDFMAGLSTGAAPCSMSGVSVSALRKRPHVKVREIYEQAKVTRLRRVEGSRHELVSARGTLRAERILMATGASSGAVLPFLWRRIVPVGSFVIATEPLAPDRIAAIMPTRRTAVTTKNIGHYFASHPMIG